MMSLFPKSVRIPVDAIRNGAERLSELSGEIQDYFDQINNVAVSLQSDGSWQGDDIIAFIEANSLNQKKYDKIIQNVSEMSEKLKEYVTIMENTDKELAARIRAIEEGV